MNTEWPKRRWFQLHLSTAVMMLFVVGVLLWANTLQRGDTSVFLYGWPIDALWDNGGLLIWILNGVVFDSVTFIAILIVTIVSCETLARGKQGVKSKHPQRRFWQLHLGTLLLIVAVAVPLFGQIAQLRRYPKFMEWDFGWPFDAGCAAPYADENPDPRYATGNFTPWHFKYSVNWPYFLTDIAFVVSILFLVTFILEFALRRRDRQRAAKAAESAVKRE